MKKKTHYKIISIPRFTTFVVLCTILFMSAIFLLAGNTVKVEAATRDADSVQTMVIDHSERLVTVDAGDTVWTIANQYNEQCSDLREAAYRIKEYNHLSAYDLYEGQELRIPYDL